MHKDVIIGSRGSELALWQANFTKNLLEKNGFKCRIQIIATQGDKIQHLSFDKLEGKGFFTKEIEDELLQGNIDLAVHSSKDMPSEQPPGLVIAGFSQSANPADTLIIRPDQADATRLWGLRSGAVVGTSSARRKAQLMFFRPDLEIKNIRGNVPTRLGKLREGQFDAIVLACAGLDRLGVSLGNLIRHDLTPEEFVPAPAQGVLAFQTRSEDREMIDIVKGFLHDKHSGAQAERERMVMAAVGGGCHAPLGIYDTREDQEPRLLVSYGKGETGPIRRLHFKAGNEAIDKAVSYFRRNEHSSVFISRELRGDDLFTRLLTQNGWKVEGESFIEFTPLPFTLDKEYEWIFFSSANAVRFFLEGTDPGKIRNCKFAALSDGTAEVLREAGIIPEFIGEGADTAAIGKQFCLRFSGRVLFPIAEQSMRSVQKEMPENTFNDLVIYRNEARKDAQVRKEEFLVFTSPLNVQAYFSRHSLSQGQRLIGIGSSTQAAFRQFGLTGYISARPSLLSLADEVLSVHAGLRG